MIEKAMRLQFILEKIDHDLFAIAIKDFPRNKYAVTI